MKGTIPTRFRDPLAKESVRLSLFRKAYRLGRPTEEHIARFRDTLFDGDPLADDVVRSISALALGEGHRLLAQAIDRGIGTVPSAPAPLTTLFAELDVRPTWLDTDKLELAARTSARVGRAGSRS
jgi:hypothetical protein